MSNALSTTEVNETDSQKSVPVNEANDQIVAGHNSRTAVALDEDGSTTIATATYLGNHFLDLTGTLAGGEDVLVPNLALARWIRDSTSGSQTVTVKVSGQTGFALTAGVWTYFTQNAAGTDVEKLGELS